MWYPQQILSTMLLYTGTPRVGCQERLGLLPKGEGVPALQGDTGGAGHHPDPRLREGIGKDCVIYFCCLSIGHVPCTINTFAIASGRSFGLSIPMMKSWIIGLYFLKIIYLL
jgi:hypothetical protein